MLFCPLAARTLWSIAAEGARCGCQQYEGPFADGCTHLHQITLFVSAQDVIRQLILGVVPASGVQVPPPQIPETADPQEPAGPLLSAQDDQAPRLHSPDVLAVEQ
jgi:hypothetical protein